MAAAAGIGDGLGQQGTAA